MGLQNSNENNELMEEKENNPPALLGLKELISLIKFFGRRVDKDVAGNITIDLVATIIVTVILVNTFPLVESLGLPYEGVVKLCYLIFIAYELPIRAVRECMRFFLRVNYNKHKLPY